MLRLSVSKFKCDNNHGYLFQFMLHDKIGKYKKENTSICFILTILHLKVLVNDMSSGPFRCGGLGFTAVAL